MPKTKVYSNRKVILNELFRTRAYTLEEIIERVANGIGESISKKTIQNDIKALRIEAAEKGAEIVCKESRYRYEPQNFNINDVKVESAAIEKIKLAAMLLKQIPGLDIHEELNEVFEKLEMRTAEIDETEQQFIQFDTRQDYTGAKFLAELLEAVKGEQVISFQYQSFMHADPIQVILHPYLLKEWNNRWYVIGLPQHLRENNLAEFHTFGLERIKSKIKPVGSIEFYQSHKFNAQTMYQHAIGITIPKAATAEKVVLQFTAHRAKYVETNPLHPSQQQIAETETHKTFSYSLILNQELGSLILSYGADVKVIAPALLKEMIATTLQSATDLYF